MLADPRPGVGQQSGLNADRIRGQIAQPDPAIRLFVDRQGVVSAAVEEAAKSAIR